ncbi:MAG: GNAT family N-acetyltransferase [Solirubrobacterales bacterium]|nr:GNAT family N-acetyltransferase [Solirubrobacterales bacterium]
MKRELAAGYELDDDPTRVDLDVVCRFLGEEAYWSKGRSRELIEKTFHGASRVVGLFAPDGSTVGYCRAHSDEVVFAYLCDVFVLEEHRGRGLGKELVREMVDGSPLRELRWLLGTADAHEMYRELGFRKPSFRIMERPGPKFADDPPSE